MKIDMTLYTHGATLPAQYADNALMTLNFANEILLALPVLRFTSGFRTVEHNKRVHGVPNSKHCLALAADFVPCDGKFTDALLEKFRVIAARHGFNCFVHNAGSGMHIHSQFMGAK